MPQTYANHTRWSPVYHFIISPILLLQVGYMIWAAIRSPSLATAADALVSAAVYGGIVMARVFALTVQNRVVRLEERLRLARLLSPEELAASEALRLPPQLPVERLGLIVLDEQARAGDSHELEPGLAGAPRQLSWVRLRM